jgi:hypothetical protein
MNPEMEPGRTNAARRFLLVYILGAPPILAISISAMIHRVAE